MNNSNKIRNVVSEIQLDGYVALKFNVVFEEGA